MLPARGKHTCRTPRGPGWVTPGTLGVAPRMRGTPAALCLQVQGKPGGLQWGPSEKPTLCQSTTISDTQNGIPNRGISISCPTPLGSAGSRCLFTEDPRSAKKNPERSRWRCWTHLRRGRRAGAGGAAGAWCGLLGAEGGSGVRVLGLRVPVGPACGHQPPTFLQRPQPRGKQVGLVSPGAFVMFERPPARRAENRCVCGTGG